MTFQALTIEQLETLASMQDHLNQLTCQANFGHPDWRLMNFNWGLAIIDEVMEIHGHLGWKWWKGSDKYQVGLTEENKKQVQLEVIDILHFGLSSWLESGRIVPTISNYDFELQDTLWELRYNSCSTVFDWSAWTCLCKAVDLNAEDIMKIYTGKYALNIFRQDHGYGDGSYEKMWFVSIVHCAPMEDNWFLEQALNDLEVMGKEITAQNVTDQLGIYYEEHINGKRA